MNNNNNKNAEGYDLWPKCCLVWILNEYINQSNKVSLHDVGHPNSI